MPDDPLESYEIDDGVCQMCGETYQLRERDRGYCTTCEDFADIGDIGDY